MPIIDDILSELRRIPPTTDSGLIAVDDPPGLVERLAREIGDQPPPLPGERADLWLARLRRNAMAAPPPGGIVSISDWLRHRPAVYESLGAGRRAAAAAGDGIGGEIVVDDVMRLILRPGDGCIEVEANLTDFPFGWAAFVDAGQPCVLIFGNPDRDGDHTVSGPIAFEKGGVAEFSLPDTPAIRRMLSVVRVTTVRAAAG